MGISSRINVTGPFRLMSKGGKLVGKYPVVIFVYKRLNETKRTIDSLIKNPQSSDTDLIVFVDGAKNESDLIAINQVVNYISSLTAFKSISITQRKENFGLAKSFIDGISEVLSKYDAAIFLEDDNLLSVDFLYFMNLALHEYLNDGKVLAVTGYSFPLIPRMTKPYFVHGAGTWSMGTWARSWDLFESDAASALLEVDKRGLKAKMNMYGIDFYSMLKKQTNGEIDSWGVRWWATAVINDMVTLYPGTPMCVNIGGNAKGTHTMTSDPLMNRESNLSQNFKAALPKSQEQSRTILIRFKLMHINLSVLRLEKRVKRLLFRLGRAN
jgi:hypothetical protein